MDKRPINPFAVGAQFLAYCVRQGWLVQEGSGMRARWYLTETGEEGLRTFGINVVLEKASGKKKGR